MKSTFLLIFYLVLNVAVYAQEATYEILVKDQPLSKVLQQIEKELGLLFSYQKKNIVHIQKDFNIKGPKNNYPLLLKQLFHQTGLSFKIVDDQYVVITKKETPEETHICGVIVDKQTKEKLPYANIIVKGKSHGSVSNIDGYFELKHLFESKDSLNISYVGYEEQTIPYAHFTNENCPTIALSYLKIKEAFLIISDYLTDGVSVEHNGASTDIKPRLCGNVAGVLEPDVLSTIQFLPGISNPSSRVSDIYIRGCKPDQNLVMWEDIPIYHTAHYFGMISAFNPFIIENTKIYRGGFNSTYGGRLGGVIELQSGSENSYKNYIGLGADMTHAKAYMHQKLNFNKPSAITFSMRRSFNELGETPTFKTYSRFNQQGLVLDGRELVFFQKNDKDEININNDFSFVDTHAKFSSTINEKNRIEIAGFFANNIFNDSINDINKRRTQKDSLYLKNYGASMKWYHHWNENWQTTLKGIATNYQVEYIYQIEDKYINDAVFLKGLKENRIKENQLNLVNLYKINEAQHFEFGYHLTHYNAGHNITEDKFRAKPLDISEQSYANVHTLYTHYQNPINNKIGIQAGFRLSYNAQAEISANKKQSWFFEPRLRLDYRLNNAISLHGSYGKHHQFLGEVYIFKGDKNGFTIPIWALAEKESIDVQIGHLYQMGAIYQAKTWVVDLQIYGRTINGLSSRLYDFEVADLNNPITGEARIKGLDLLIKKRTGKLRSWLSYSLNQTTLFFKERGKDRNLGDFSADYEQPHVFDFTNQLRLQNWHLALGFKIASGLPYTEIVGYKESPINNMLPPDEMMPPNMGMPPIPTELEPEYGAINVPRLSATKSINLSAEYQLKPSSQKWKMYAGCSVKNILNFKNIASRYYTLDPINRENPIRQIDKLDLPFTPNVTIRFEW